MDSTIVDRIQRLQLLYPDSPLILRVRRGSKAVELFGYYKQGTFEKVSFSQSPEKNAPAITFNRDELEDKVGVIMDENYVKKVVVGDAGRMRYLLYSEKNRGLFAFRDKPVRLQFNEKKMGTSKIIKATGYFQGAEETEQSTQGKYRYEGFLGLVPENDISLKKDTLDIRSRRKFRKNVTLDAMFGYHFELPLVIELIEGSKDIREVHV